MKVRILVPVVIIILASVVGAAPAQARGRDGLGPGRALITSVDHFQACNNSCHSWVRASGYISVDSRSRKTISLSCVVLVWQTYPSPPWVPGQARVLLGLDQVSITVYPYVNTSEPWSVLGAEESGTITLEKICTVL